MTHSQWLCLAAAVLVAGCSSEPVQSVVEPLSDAGSGAPTCQVGGTATFGPTRPGSLWSGGQVNDRKRASQVQVTQSGTLTQAEIFLDGNGGGDGGCQSARLAVYADQAGAPGSLVATGTAFAVTAGAAGAWYTSNFSPIHLAAGAYWIAELTDGTVGVTRYNGNTGTYYFNANPYSAGPSNPFGAAYQAGIDLSMNLTLACPSGDAGTASADAGITPDAGAPPPDAGPRCSGVGCFNPPYPRNASYRIGGSQTYGAAFQAWASKQAVVIIGGNWEGWASSGRSREAVIQGIKSQSMLGTKVLQYGDCDAVSTTNDGFPTFTAQINANNWYLWLVGSSGTHVTNSYSPDFWQTNSTDSTSSDKYGRKLEDAFAVYVDAEYRTGGTANAAPSLDGHYHDNMLFYARVNGDFDRNGTTDTGQSFGLQWRTGERRYLDQLKAIDPELIRFGNTDDMHNIGVTDPTNIAAASPLDGIMQGALDEGFLGKSYSVETYINWDATMAEYKFRMNLTIPPKLVVLGHGGMAANGADPYTATPYQAMRYGVASVALDDGYYAFSPDGYPDDVLFWFDELGGNAGGPPLGYLGYPTQAPPTVAWQSGVWRRDFDHGIVLVNPKGNGAKTVSLGGTFKHLTGTQNPSLNNGASVTSVTLQDRDGLILLRP
jgi:hypothetical protein